MPRNVRNFWIELDVDGKKTRIACGPARADGGFSLSVKMRSDGGIVRALDVSGYAGTDGTVVLDVSEPAGIGSAGPLTKHDGCGFIVRTRRDAPKTSVRK